MKKKILIGSILAALLLLSMPFISTLQAQSASQEITDESCESCNSMPSNEERQNLIIAIQNLIDFLESLGCYGALAQQLQDFIDTIINWEALLEAICMLIFYLVLTPIGNLLLDLEESEQWVLFFALGILMLPIFEAYVAFGCGQFDFDENFNYSNGSNGWFATTMTILGQSTSQSSPTNS